MDKRNANFFYPVLPSNCSFGESLKKFEGFSRSMGKEAAMLYDVLGLSLCSADECNIVWFVSCFMVRVVEHRNECLPYGGL